MDAQTTLLVTLVCLEPFLVVLVAPQVTRRVTERHATAFFEANILPRVAASVEAKLRDVLAGAAPSPEAQAAAQASIADAIRGAVADAVNGQIRDAASLLSQRGVDGRASKAARHEAFFQAILEHPKGGPLVAAAVEQFADYSPRVFDMATRAGPEHVAAFLEKHADKLNGLPGMGPAKKAALQVV